MQSIEGLDLRGHCWAEVCRILGQRPVDEPRVILLDEPPMNTTCLSAGVFEYVPPSAEPGFANARVREIESIYGISEWLRFEFVSGQGLTESGSS